MKKYKVRYPFDGTKLGKEFSGKKMVAVPEKYFEQNGRVAVYYKDQHMVVTNEPESISEPFQDRFGGDDYRLYYYEWNPENKLLI